MIENIRAVKMSWEEFDKELSNFITKKYAFIDVAYGERVDFNCSDVCFKINIDIGNLPEEFLNICNFADEASEYVFGDNHNHINLPFNHHKQFISDMLGFEVSKSFADEDDIVFIE